MGKESFVTDSISLLLLLVMGEMFPNILALPIHTTARCSLFFFADQGAVFLLLMNPGRFSTSPARVQTVPAVHPEFMPGPGCRPTHKSWHKKGQDAVGTCFCSLPKNKPEAGLLVSAASPQGNWK